MNDRQLRRLMQLLAQPTAPFREGLVMSLARTWLERAGLPHFHDPAGNLVVGCGSSAAYRALLRTTGEPLRLFIAHTDHPGFHGQRWLGPTRLLVKWHGGSPVRHLRGARVWLADEHGPVAEGEMLRARLLAARHAIDTAELRLTAPLAARPAAHALYGGFRFRAPVWRAGRRLYTKAADDLVGVFALLETALALARGRRRAPPFLGLLTRAEEVGFVGALAHFELGWLTHARRPVVAVSLETSRTLPGARIGQGPIVRLGDRRTVFDPGYLRVLSELAEDLLPGRHQRRVMDGGTCEATAALACGLPAIGLSVPLGNYHNEGFEGGVDCAAPRGPAPEFVHLDDVAGLLKLCRGLLQPGLAWDEPWKNQRRRLRSNLRRYQKLLKPVSPPRRQGRKGNGIQ
jgi:endoglucanase